MPDDSIRQIQVIAARAKLLCVICSHVWERTMLFANFASIERHDFSKMTCPKCAAQNSFLLPVIDDAQSADAFGNPIDDDDPADAWKRG